MIAQSISHRSSPSECRAARFGPSARARRILGTRVTYDEHEREVVQNQRRSVVRRWLGRLDKRERRILASRYGIGGAPEQTLAQIAQELGISQERVRQIAVRAHAKLRKFARLEALETLEI